MSRFCLMFTMALLSLAAFAEEELTTRVTNVALFKQGYGCVLREATLPAGEREFVINDVPTPVHGTFWLMTPPGITLQSIVATEGAHTQAVPAITLLELLRANIGEVIEIKLAEGWVSGKLLSIAEQRVEHASPPYITPGETMSSRRLYNGAPMTSMSVEQADLLTIDTAEGALALPVSRVMQLRKRDGALRTSFSRTLPGTVLRVRASGAGGRVQIAYLTPGLTWAPSYHLRLSGKTAHLSAKAVVINDAEDLQAHELSCVAGFPNMKFAHVADPLALRESMTQFLTALQQPSAGANRPSVMTQAVMMNSVMPSVELPPAAPNPLDSGDLHWYRAGSVALRRGERAYLPLFEQDVAYSDVYRWDARDLRENVYLYGWRNDDEKTPLAEDVWHAVRLQNAGALPWTTAPVMVTDGTQFLGQDILYYTSPGSGTLVNITKAVDVKARMSENTVEERNTIVLNGNTYRIFVVAGRLLVTNYQQDPVHLVINKKLTGDLIETSLTPGAVNEEPRLDIANPRRTAIWEVDIPAGRTQEITYKYKIYVR